MNNDDGLNGKYHPCKVGEEWQSFLDEFSEARKHCKELSTTMELILKNTNYLMQLPAVAEELTALKMVMGDVKDTLLKPALGENRIPLAVMETLVKSQQDSSTYVHRLMGKIIIGLMIIIASMIIGSKTKLIDLPFWSGEAKQIQPSEGH